MMVWMTFLVAPFAYREGLLVRLESLVGYLPKRGRSAIEVGAHILVAVTLIVLLRETFWMVERGSGIRSSALNVSMGWVFAVMPVSFLLLLSVTFELTISTFFDGGRASETIANSGEAQ
jgi:TRAP-type C4-dicarboxylate transport system permease small subunit